jgi:single-strand DNA-binding protein
MRSINKVILIGNLTRDPELKTTPGGQNIVTFGLATNRDWVTKDGRKNSMTEFHDLVAWANLAEICQKYLKKGKLVYVEGYLKTRSWDLPDGTRKFRTEIVVQDMIMLDKRAAGEMTDFIPEEFIETQETAEQAPPAHKHRERALSAETAEGDEKIKEKNEVKTPTKKEKETPKETAKTEPASPASVTIDTDLGL